MCMLGQTTFLLLFLLLLLLIQNVYVIECVRAYICVRDAHARAFASVWEVLYLNAPPPLKTPPVSSSPCLDENQNLYEYVQCHACMCARDIVHACMRQNLQEYVRACMCMHVRVCDAHACA